ncbi:2OG-Fe(II)oxygenase superfamily protein [Rutstroemia sp. NJR-2017a BBW]|nr:2OG-Fe(II)oxygenase superfamily protein [Rutstroemia sp. NJR-2017a BBW]
MSSSAPQTTKLELRTAYGPVYRDVLPNPPRDCTASEIPIIDLTPLSSSSITERKALAAEIRSAAVGTGFFYVKNHGIPAETIENARQQALNPGESVDVKETLAWRYEPQYDPDPKPLDAVPEEVKPWIRGESFVWEGTSHLPNFKEDTLAYWASCLTLARKLVRVFALSLDLPEDYFDSRVTYPGADGLYNYYPPVDEEEKANNSVGLGSHTDLQLFTLLWQDMIGGLQVLNKDGQWIKAVPVEGTIVVNIGDFMMRLCNDIYKSTVHRVYNRATAERISMPFFFGLNFNCVEGVIPTCTDEDNPPKYEPISCGDWCQLRFKLENDEMKKNTAQAKAPSAVVVGA